MPIVNIKLFSGRTYEMKKRAAEKITDIVVEELKAKREAVVIVYQDIDKENWCRNGKMLSEVD